MTEILSLDRRVENGRHRVLHGFAFEDGQLQPQSSSMASAESLPVRGIDVAALLKRVMAALLGMLVGAGLPLSSWSV